MIATELRVLVLDDSALERRIARRLLEQLGVSGVLEAADGHQAIDLLAAAGAPIDVILCDLDMPGMDGIEFIQHFAQHHHGAAVVLVSSMERALLASVATMAQSFGVRLLGVIEKPLTAERLRAVLDAYRLGGPTAPPTSVRRVFSLAELRDALDAGALVPFFQAKVNLQTGEVGDAEALVRWPHPTQGLVVAEDFVPLLEQNGLADRLTELMLERCAAQLQRWNDAGERVSIAVNISVLNMSDANAADRILATARRHEIDPRQITLEVTESGIARNLGDVLAGLARLRLRGFGLAIDDFGTGYSSLQQLSRIPFTELKVDRCFVSGAAANPRARAMLESALELARKLGITTVAEGIEKREDWDLLLSLGCDYAQGYFVSPALPPEEFIAWRRVWSPPS